MLTAQEVAQHSTRESCWIIIAGEVYDVTDFLDQHAGGPSVILRYAGRDATEEYEPTHSPTALQDSLPAERRLGPVDPTTVTPGPRKGLTGSTTHVLSNPKECPSLSTIISLQDFEARASRGLSCLELQLTLSIILISQTLTGSCEGAPFKEDMGILFVWCDGYGM